MTGAVWKNARRPVRRGRCAVEGRGLVGAERAILALRPGLLSDAELTKAARRVEPLSWAQGKSRAAVALSRLAPERSAEVIQSLLTQEPPSEDRLLLRRCLDAILAVARSQPARVADAYAK